MIISYVSYVCSSSDSCLFVLTDGVPNLGLRTAPDFPKAIKTYKETHGGDLPGAIHTFGFGYSLDSHLLALTAEAGLGLFSFIPDR